MAYELLDHGGEGVVAIRLTDDLTRGDFERLYSLLAERSAEHGSVRLYEEAPTFGASGFLSASIHGFVPDLVYGDRITVERTAVVANDRWAWLLASLWRLLGPVWPMSAGALRFFDLAEREEALSWITRGRGRAARGGGATDSW